MKGLLWTVLIACGLAAGPAAAQPPGAAPGAAEMRRADIAAFRAGFLERDKSYSAAARAEAAAALAQLEAGADGVSQAGFELELARIVALADNAHTIVLGEPFLRHFNRTPMRLAPFGADFYVVRAQGAHADLLGARLTAIDATPIAEARAAAHAILGGTPARRDRWLPYALESVAIMHELGAARAPDAAVYTFEHADGRRIERRLAAAPFAERAHFTSTDRLLAPAPIEGEDGSWRTLLAAADAPWSLQGGGMESLFRWRALPELDALLIDMHANVSVGERDLGAFLAEAGREIDRRKPRHLILDMRFNGGGDLTQTRVFMSQLPARVPGRVFVLTSPWTFSAGISSTAYVKQAAPERVTIVGEEVGDRLEFFAEGQVTALPHSGLLVLNATERHDYRNGCREFRDCHRFVVDMPIAVPSLTPDISAPWTIEAYRAGRDPAMEAVAAALRGGR